MAGSAMYELVRVICLFLCRNSERILNIV
jgi:hypothetical protein